MKYVELYEKDIHALLNFVADVDMEPYMNVKQSPRTMALLSRVMRIQAEVSDIGEGQPFTCRIIRL